VLGLCGGLSRLISHSRPCPPSLPPSLPPQAYYMYISSNRWLAMRLEFVGACIVSLAGIFSILGRDHGKEGGREGGRDR
jgi:hypothetical protein